MYRIHYKLSPRPERKHFRKDPPAVAVFSDLKNCQFRLISVSHFAIRTLHFFNKETLSLPFISSVIMNWPIVSRQNGKAKGQNSSYFNQAGFGSQTRIHPSQRSPLSADWVPALRFYCLYIKEIKVFFSTPDSINLKIRYSGTLKYIRQSCFWP